MKSNSKDKKLIERNNVTEVFGMKSKSSSRKKDKTKSRGGTTPEDGNITPNIMEKQEKSKKRDKSSKRSGK